MLGKLLKYEVKAAGKVMPALYLGIGLSYLLGKLTEALHIHQMKIGLAIACIGIGIASMVLALILTVMRYAKGLFGAEGYLTQTLPVRKGTLLASKVITGYLLILLGVVGFLLGLFGMFDLLQIEGILEMLKAGLGNAALPLLLLFLVFASVQLFSSLSAVYFSITLSNTRPFLSNNFLFAVVFYLAGSTVIGLLEIVFMLLLPIGVRVGESGGLHLGFDSMLLDLLKHPELIGSNQDPAVLTQMSLGVGSVIVDLAAGMVLLFVTRWLLTRKISVK